MKIALFTVIILTIVCSFTACKEPEKGPEESSTAATTASSVISAPQAFVPAENGFVFEYDGTRVVLGTAADAVISALGEPRSVFESPSCAFEGIDKTFFYNDFYIQTFPWENEDYISVVHFQTDGVGTVEGLYIGMDAGDMFRLYGEVYTKDLGMYTFTKNGAELAVLVEDGEIVQITYYLIQ